MEVYQVGVVLLALRLDFDTHDDFDDFLFYKYSLQ